MAGNVTDLRNRTITENTEFPTGLAGCAYVRGSAHAQEVPEWATDVTG